MLPEENFPLHNAAARSSFWAVGATGPRPERPSWLRAHGWRLEPVGLRTPYPASQPRRTPGEWVSGAGDPGPQSSRAQGARGSPAPLCLLENGGPGAKSACIAFLSPGASGLLLGAQGEFSIAEYRCQKLVLRRKCDGVSALIGRAVSGGMAGAWAQKDFARPILLPRQGEPVGSGFGESQTASKAAGPWEPGAARPGFALGRAEGRGRNRLALLS